MNPTMQQLAGISRHHLGELSEGVWLHRDVLVPFGKLRDAAAREGITLAVASGFRDFDRQLAIWNRKARGELTVWDIDGAAPLDIARLSERELVFAILRWSALPGASRHHWGTDMDVWDSAAGVPEYRPQLIPGEYGAGGPFARLGEWLASGTPQEYGFTRPYDRDRGGVHPEAWHISYGPLAEEFAGAFDFPELADHLARADLCLKGAILENLDEIARRLFF